MTVFGVDFSLTATGLASWDGQEWDTATVKASPVDSSPGAFLDRVDLIAARAISWCDPHAGDIICIEGPALHAKSSQLDRMFGGWWRLYAALRDHHAEPWVIPPTVVKQLATGRGNAGKDEVLLATARRLGAPVHNTDESDAAWLAVAGSYIEGNPIVSLPEAHTRGIVRMIS